jgi:hypothetical protein
VGWPIESDSIGSLVYDATNIDKLSFMLYLCVTKYASNFSSFS